MNDYSAVSRLQDQLPTSCAGWSRTYGHCDFGGVPQNEPQSVSARAPFECV